MFLNETPSTVRRAHDGPSWYPSSQPFFPEINSAAQTTKQVVTYFPSLSVFLFVLPSLRSFLPLYVLALSIFLIQTLFFFYPN